MDSNLDTGFNDVFGGPPRRSSVQGTRYSFGENIMDSSSGFRTSDETVVVVPRNPWTGLSEKPVFGEEGIISRRKYSKSDFFDDIFGGNESLSSSPRTSAPVSRILSPCRPLPPKAKPFGTSFPSQLSLPAKLNKGMDLPISKSTDGSSNGSSNYAYSPMSRLPGQENQDKNQEMRSDYQGNSKENSNSSEILGNDVNRFHFSIYKWANKGGVPFDISLRGSHRFKQKGNLQRCIRANDLIASGNIAMEQKENLHNNFSSTDRMSSNDKNEHGSPIDSKNKVDEPVRIIEENNIPKSESESLSKSTGEVVLPGSEADKKTQYSLSTVGKDTYKPRPKHPNLVFDYGNNDEPSNDEITKSSDISEKNAEKLSEILDGVNIKKQNMNKRATSSSNNVEASTTSLRKSPRKSWDKGKSRARGNVRDFIKIFNQDASPKPRADIVSENHGSGLKQRHSVKPEIKTNISMNESEEKIQRPNIQKKKNSSDVHVDNHMINSASEMNTNSPAKDTVFDGSKTIAEDPIESSEVDYSIEDLTPVPEEKISPQYGIDPEEMQAIDAKIRQWSNGKQGNIRSLLSTLQFVLWPDSGWKQVPLADIIEGRTVKRSYQKALLCLHPDKLQQKGAASNKKYIAEKVFDILQDAWDQFNLIGSI